MSWSSALRWVRNGRAPVGELQDRCLDLGEPPRVQGGTQAAQHGRLRADDLARLRAQHHVHVAQPHPGLVGERAVLVGQRAKGLGGDRPVGRLHRELAAPAGHHLAADREQVAEVDQRLEVGQ
jgi:hypothetical protein